MLKIDNSFLFKDDVENNLWQEYTKTVEYANGLNFGIAKNHLLVLRREEAGLKSITTSLIGELKNTRKIYLTKLKDRAAGDWIKEWCNWHKQLFKFVLKKRGKYREYDVRFGSPGDEEIYKIPKAMMLGQAVAEFAEQVCDLMKSDVTNKKKIITLLAKIHYHFISIHPFPDGNGRIGRMIIDQLALAYGYPTIMGGYPRSDVEKIKIYHQAIKTCADGDYSLLEYWIEDKLKLSLEVIG